MKISTRLRYGLRFLIDLALHSKKEPVPLKEIAERQQISLNYLRQLVLPLETHGLIQSFRGNRGGYTLNRPPENISLLEVAQVLEGPIQITECVNNFPSCTMLSECRTRWIWEEISHTIERILAEKNLKDVLERSEPR